MIADKAVAIAHRSSRAAGSLIGCRQPAEVVGAALLATAYNTGARVSELTGRQIRNVLLDRQIAVHLQGKGRKQRGIPLWKNTATELRGRLNQRGRSGI